MLEKPWLATMEEMGGEDAEQSKTLVENEQGGGGGGADEEEAKGGNCCERFLHCLSQVPCASLVAWILLLLGLGGITGSLLIGVQKTRDLLEAQSTLWFMEYTLIGVVAGMFVVGTLLLVVGHLSTDPTSRHVFSTSQKNTCARALNIVMLLLSYFLGVAWILLTAIIAVPVVLLVLLFILTNIKKVECINLMNYAFEDREICSSSLTLFRDDAKDVLICYIIAFFSSMCIAISMVHFMICISSNLMHLKDNRFATLNAYEEPEEIHNSKHSVVADTTM